MKLRPGTILASAAAVLTLGTAAAFAVSGDEAPRPDLVTAAASEDPAPSTSTTSTTAAPSTTLAPEPVSPSPTTAKPLPPPEAPKSASVTPSAPVSEPAPEPEPETTVPAPPPVECSLSVSTVDQGGGSWLVSWSVTSNRPGGSLRFTGVQKDPNVYPLDSSGSASGSFVSDPTGRQYDGTLLNARVDAVACGSAEVAV
jgi:hypothetical protein